MAFYAGVQVARLALRRAVRSHQQASHKEDQGFYQAERLPVFAPPPLAFPIAWTIINIAAIAGGLHVLNLPRGTKGRREFLLLQAAAWLLFSTFEAAYFGLRSPINAALITLLYSGVNTASMNVARRRLHDSFAARSLAPTAAWLALANPVGITQAAWNYDRFWDAGPFVEPHPRLLKAATGG